MGLKMNIAKTNVMVVDNTPINVNNVQIENVYIEILKDIYTDSSVTVHRPKKVRKSGSREE